VAACGHRLLVDVDAEHRRRTQTLRGERQDARAATVVEHRGALSQVRIDPLQTEAGGGVAAGAERQTWIQDEAGAIGRRLAPGGHDPQARTDVDRFELGLCESHPVLLSQALDLRIGQIDAQSCAGPGQRAMCIDVGREQRLDEALRPDSGHRIRLPVLRLLVRRTGQRVTGIDRKCAELQQGILEALGMLGRGAEAQLQVGRTGLPQTAFLRFRSRSSR